MTRPPNGIPKNLYLELIYFCRQYDHFVKLARESVGRIADIDAVREAAENVALIERAAINASDRFIAQHLLNNVCRDVKFEHLYNVPCSTGKFWEYRKEFLNRLAKAKNRI